MRDEGETLLQEILSKEADEYEAKARASANNASIAQPVDEEDRNKADKENHTQWALGGNGRFMPVGSTAPILPPGIYEPFAVPGMWGLERSKIASDNIYVLPDMATEVVLEEVRKFWASEHKYREHHLLYKRGIILWGPPGGGKTVAVKLLMSELVKNDGIVILAQNIDLTNMCLKAIRRIEPKRNLIVVLEDIDEIINYNSEARVLSLLDGENSIDNILHVATTNYPERLGARIFNRPSRFDRRVYVGMPSKEARMAYLSKATRDGLDKERLEQWTKDTDNLSIAHLRELVAAVYCLDQPYDDVLKRLREMTSQVKADDGWSRGKLGFGGLKATKEDGF